MRTTLGLDGAVVLKVQRKILSVAQTLAVTLLACGAFISQVHAQDPATMPHTLRVSVVTPPAGPNSNFAVKLTIEPADVDISGFSIVVGYDNTRATLLSATDNTGQFSGVQYGFGNDTPFTGNSYANIYVPFIMSTSADLVRPVNLAQLNFRTTAAYNDPTNKFYVFIEDWPRNGCCDAGVSSGFGNGGPKDIPITYASLEPTSAGVSDWQFYE